MLRSIVITLLFSLIGLETFAGPSYALPPPEAMVAILMLLILVGLIVCRSVSWIVRFFLQKMRGEHRKCLWLQTLCGMLLIVMFILVQENFRIISTYGSGYTMLFIVIAFCPVLGAIIGYFLSPIVKRNSTDREAGNVQGN